MARRVSAVRNQKVDYTGGANVKWGFASNKKGLPYFFFNDRIEYLGGALWNYNRS